MRNVRWPFTIATALAIASFAGVTRGDQTVPPALAASAAVEQTSQGSKPALAVVESFDGIGYGVGGAEATTQATDGARPASRNPSDNSLAVGPDHIFQIVNSRLAVFTKKGKRFDTTGRLLYGPIPTNTEAARPGQAADPGPPARPGPPPPVPPPPAGRGPAATPGASASPPRQSQGSHAMCYAISVGPDPLGEYYRYVFERPLFPDYPRPAVWPDGYYIPTSTGDEVIEKHTCIVDRSKMLEGKPATEQCIVINGVNFLNNADLEGTELPPPGTPNIMMATGGTQLEYDIDDDGVYVWKVHVDWQRPINTTVTGPRKINVAPYRYLCGGQLTSCVSQPGTDRRLDAQGDKIMARLLYRNVGGRESIVAVHSVDTSAGGGGVRWYEFRLDKNREVYLHQQSTYAPDGFFRWMASPAIDRAGNIAIGYSFGGDPNYPGQRFAARLANDPPGLLTFHETVLAEGEASQTNTIRWEDYTQTAMDPADDCTIWYVGDFFKKDAPSYSTRIGSFRLPDCLGR